MDIHVALNKKRIPSEIFFGLIVSGILYFVIINSKEGSIFYSYNFMFIFFFIYALGYTLFAILNYLKILFDKNAGLIISDSCFYKNVSLLSRDSIAWADIIDAEVVEKRRTSVLFIKLSDNKKYLSDKNFLQRYFLNVYIKRWGTPILIPKNFVLYDLGELKNIIIEKMRSHASDTNHNSLQ